MDCKFQDLVYELEVDENNPPGLHPSFAHEGEWKICPKIGEPVDSQPSPIAKAISGENKTPYSAIVLDLEKCIKCGRCIKACEQLQGIEAIGFVERGDINHVGQFGGLFLDDTKCIQCGQCSFFKYFFRVNLILYTLKIRFYLFFPKVH
jgi:predicted molibdopterin-dependent oxidoreductase YjgC